MCQKFRKKKPISLSYSNFSKWLLLDPFKQGLPCGSAGKESTCNAGDLGSIPGLGKIPWRRERLPAPGLWPGEFQTAGPWGQRVGHHWVTFTFTLSRLQRMEEVDLCLGFHYPVLSLPPTTSAQTLCSASPGSSHMAPRPLGPAHHPGCSVLLNTDSCSTFPCGQGGSQIPQKYSWPLHPHSAVPPLNSALQQP